MKIILVKFSTTKKKETRKKTQTQIYVFALQRRRLRNFPSLCFMLRFFFFHFIFSVVTKSLRLLSCPSISNTKHTQSGSRSSSNCNTNPLALSLRESVISVGKEQSWKINKKQKLARKFKKNNCTSLLKICIQICRCGCLFEDVCVYVQRLSNNNNLAEISSALKRWKILLLLRWN